MSRPSSHHERASVLLNVDAGEHPDEPEALYPLAHALNIACGGHAGDDASMERVLRACRAHGVRAGAHPSYPDPASFGRVSMSMEPAALARSIREQCARLAAIAASVGVPVAHAKLHGALYHDANRDPALAAATLGAVVDALGPVTVVGPPHGQLGQFCAREGLRYEREGFADRSMRSDGTLVPRTDPNAMITDPSLAVAQARALAGSGHDTLCVHADTAGALEIARAVRAALDVR